MQGWSISSILLAVLNLVFGGTAVTTLGIWLKTRPQMRTAKLTGDDKLREDLILRVQKLETMMETERANHEIELRLMRHRLNNSDASLEALLLILDDDDLPERLKRKVQRIREDRVRKREAEERERDTLRAASIAAVKINLQGD